MTQPTKAFAFHLSLIPRAHTVVERTSSQIPENPSHSVTPTGDGVVDVTQTITSGFRLSPLSGYKQLLGLGERE